MRWARTYWNQWYFSLVGPLDYCLYLVFTIRFYHHEGLSWLYKAFIFSESDELKGTPEENYWKEVDVNWENSVSVSVSTYVVVSLYTQLLYDKQISKKGRFKETLSLGLTYKMF